MHHSAPAQTQVARDPRLVLVLGLAALTALSFATFFRQPVPSSVPPSGAAPDKDGGVVTRPVAAATVRDGIVNEHDGALPDGVTAFDDGYPGVANLDAALLRALRAAAMDAAYEGIEIQVNSGWRSVEYQEQLFREAVDEYGSEAEAARWVAPASTSAHVSGEAVDIGPFAAATWLSEHGARYGLCQTYRNEAWHYELRPEAISGRCPRMDPGPAREARSRH